MRKKKTFPFGTISVEDDISIEIFSTRRKAFHSFCVEVFRFFRDILFVLMIFILFGVFIAQPVVVEGTSMLPVLHDGERLLVNKLIYYKWKTFSWARIERGDVVVFWYPKDPEKSFVKRVIGLPGETVEVRNGVVYINGKRLYENYLDPEYNRNAANFPLKKIEEHYYFVMGDNRDNSSDSRYWGLVPEKYIYGKAFFRFWPSNIGFIEKGQYEIKFEDERDFNLVEGAR
ncbi:MAG: signal peptidase I [Pyrinomonadaceae bacterium]|nr:signal peptidase I [Pyrinomonadaceae bacterium]MCX7639645.1 signal peptidase I [Pyrinomonadaceae bacterium]MDW8303337.1 signal peptidase I [Acidobacteriota bacterium]